MTMNSALHATLALTDLRRAPSSVGMVNLGIIEVGNPRGWAMAAGAAGLGALVGSAVGWPILGGALAGTTALAFFGYVSAFAGAPMFELPLSPHSPAAVTTS